MKQVIVILSDIRSIYNVGSIFRTADGAGVEKIFLCGITPTPLDRFRKTRKDFTKVSLGAEKTIAWEYKKQLSSLITKLKKEKYIICAVEQTKNSIPYNTFKTKHKKIALVFGNEVKGISEKALKKCDTILEIPMRGEKESLNVSVAFGVTIYDVIKNK